MISASDDTFTAAKRELELKYDLSNLAGYQRLLEFLRKRCPEGAVCEQENVFYDTASHALSERKIALRVRTERRPDAPTVASVTLKGETEQTDELADRPEIESTISEAEAISLAAGGFDLRDLTLEPIKRINDMIGSEKLLPLVSFTNRRETVLYRKENNDKHTFAMEVDRTQFSDESVEYELEIESTNAQLLAAAREVVAEIFSQLSIPLTPQTRSKLQRALARKN